MKILVTMPDNDIRKTFFTPELQQRLQAMGEVVWNTLPCNFTKEELADALPDVEVAVTGWGTPRIEGEVLAAADALKLIAHTGGTVKPYVGEDAYDKGIRVTCGNDVFAASVAEGVIGYMLAGLREIPRYNNMVKSGIWPEQFYNRGLMHKKIGIVGYGAISRKVVHMLQVFEVEIYVYSRYIEETELQKYDMKKSTLEEIFTECDVVSLHSALTPQNEHMITGDLVSLMKPGALLVNTARGGIINEKEVFPILGEGNILAVLDVFEEEPIRDAGHPLCHMENVIMMPHMGGPTIDRRAVVTDTVLRDIDIFYAGGTMKGEIEKEVMKRMSTC